MWVGNCSIGLKLQRYIKLNPAKVQGINNESQLPKKVPGAKDFGNVQFQEIYKNFATLASPY